MILTSKQIESRYVTWILIEQRILSRRRINNDRTGEKTDISGPDLLRILNSRGTDRERVLLMHAISWS